jgi:primosomal protein N' (replication factor Y)
VYAAVVISEAIQNQPLTYRIPAELSPQVGEAVVVPLGTRSVVGYVVGLAEACDPAMEAKIRPIEAVIEGSATFNEELYGIAEWVANTRLAEIRDAIRLIAPDVMSARMATTWTLSAGYRERMDGTRSALQRSVVDALETLGGSASADQIARALPDETVGPALAELRRKGVAAEWRAIVRPKAKEKTVRVLRLAVDVDAARAMAGRLQRRALRQSQLLLALADASGPADASVPTAGIAIDAGYAAAGKALVEKGLAVSFDVGVYRNPFPLLSLRSTEPPALTDAQTDAVRTISGHVARREAATVLLHGITGSGKTEVYLACVQDALHAGLSALVLVPEIALTAQLLDLFRGRFGDTDVAVLHSALSLGERFDEWQRIRRGEARVVVGPRSAVFAPVVKLGLIVIDEEHDGSYKQENGIRYHARDVAEERARRTQAVVVLGSATPAIESFYKARSGAYELLTLPQRIDSRPLPAVEVVDMREEFRNAPSARTPLEGGARGRKDAGGPPEAATTPDETTPNPSLEQEGRTARSIFGRRLTEAIGERLERKEQAILFLNRRGFASFLLCRDCGLTPRCPNCDVSLTYHRGARALRCHHCDHRERAPEVCPQCGGLRILPFGLGTEKVEETVRTLFPEARTLRMDRDTMSRKGSHAEALAAFRRGDADVLIGTQIVTKGLDFPNVTLVGVVSADVALNMPDFRSGERAFQLLTQVAGRAGRGDRPGEVVVQTFCPEHPSVGHAAGHDYAGFFADEITHRRELRYPPFASLANVVAQSEQDETARRRCDAMAVALRAAASERGVAVDVLGPVPCPLARLRGLFRWHVVLRAADRAACAGVLRAALGSLAQAERQGLSLDLDPLTMV